MVRDIAPAIAIAGVRGDSDWDILYLASDCVQQVEFELGTDAACEAKGRWVAVLAPGERIVAWEGVVGVIESDVEGRVAAHEPPETVEPTPDEPSPPWLVETASGFAKELRRRANSPGHITLLKARAQQLADVLERLVFITTECLHSDDERLPPPTDT